EAKPAPVKADLWATIYGAATRDFTAKAWIPGYGLHGGGTLSWGASTPEEPKPEVVEAPTLPQRGGKEQVSALLGMADELQAMSIELEASLERAEPLARLALQNEVDGLISKSKDLRTEAY